MLALEHTAPHVIEGENKNYIGKWFLCGEVVLGVDLSQAKYLAIDKNQRTVTLQLPAPHVISSKVDHERSEEAYVRQKGILPIHPGDQSLRDEVWKHADRKIRRLGEHDGYLQVCKHQTERELEKFFGELGWKITYKWPTVAATAWGSGQ